MKRRPRSAPWVALLGLASSLGCSRPGPPNVLLFTLDTTRADRLGCYGAGGVETPNLDRVAREGARFERAVTPVPQTLPAHATIFTGRVPPAHTVRVNGAVLPPGVETLAERLASRGYETAAFVGSAIVGVGTGIDRGFERFDGNFGSSPGEERDRPGDAVNRALFDWLGSRDRSRPLFLWVHYFDPHDPYAPPEPFASRYRGRPYDGEVAYMDACFGRALEALEEAGALAESLLVVAADHGESLGDHGEATHAVFLYESTVRVPLMFRRPGRLTPKAVSGTAGLDDVAPTILDLVGEGTLPGAQGRSLVPAMESGTVDPPLPSYLESIHPYESFRWGWLRGVTTDEWKWIDSVRPELYRLAQDPGEERNLQNVESTIAARLGEVLDRLAAEAAEAGSSLEGAHDPNAEDTLRALGYAGGSPAGLPSVRPPRDPKDFVHLVARIDEAKAIGFGRGDPAGAIPILEGVAAEDATNPQVPVYLGLFSWRLRRLEEADAHLSRALALDPDQPWALTLHAIVAAERGNLAEAESRFREGIRRRPTYAQLKANFAKLLLGLGRRDEAESFAREATRDHPRLFAAWEALGEALLEARPPRTAEALAALEEASKLGGDEVFRARLARVRAGR
jgi:arylsulfatase A-like enzyme/Flp pilus assembly protein TadD